jgi:protein-S-isoprenylcysteine O-methyltransferase Ste14
MSAPPPGAARRPGPAHPLAAAALALAVVAFDAALLAVALGGPRALLAHPRALALLAVYAATGVPLALRRPVRDQDVVARAADPPWRLLLLFLVPLVIPAVSAWGERAHLGALPGRTWLGWLGVALVAAGLALRLGAMTTLGARFAPVAALQREHALERRGPYAVVRHPGYLGAWLAALGAMLAFVDGLAMPLLVLFSWLLAARARDEDAMLEREFGDEYRAWASRTGAFLPRWGAVRTDGESPPRRRPD